MSGFICAFNRSGEPVDTDRWAHFLAEIDDVGGEGSWQAQPHPWLALGEAVRIDGPTANVAATTSRNRKHCTITGDVRIDNRVELCGALDLTPATLSDLELVLAAYLAWGPDCVTRFIGEFSFVLWDDRDRQLLAARDHMGDRALYYRTDDKTLVLSNEIRVPRDWSQAAAEVDEDTFAGVLVRKRLFMRDPERTLFKGVLQVPPGHFLLASSDSLRVQSYWSLADLSSTPLPPAPLEDLQAEFREILAEAVRCRLPTHHGVGSHLSGGLDSSTLACLAASELAPSGRTLSCFTHVTREPIEDISPAKTVREEKFIAAIGAQYPNIAQHWAYGDERAVLSGIEAQFYFGGVAHPNYFQTWWDEINAAAGSAGLRTVLIGTSGNLTASWVGPSPAPSRRKRLRRWLARHLLPITDHVKARHRSVLRADKFRQLGVRERLIEAADRSLADPRASGLGRGFNGLYRSYAMARFGVELSDPLSDRRVMEFCLRAPGELYRRNGMDRLLVRDSMRGIVPDLVLERRSRQLQSAHWVDLIKQLQPRLNSRLDALAANDLASSFIDVSYVRTSLTRLETESTNVDAMFRWNENVLHALAMGAFLVWVSDGCPRPNTEPVAP